MNTTEPVVEIRPVKISGQHNDQLSDGLLAQLVESCTGIAEVTGSNPGPEFFSTTSSVVFITAGSILRDSF